MVHFLLRRKGVVVYFHLLIVFKIAVKKSSCKSYEYINNKADDPPFGCTIHKL
ncbi:MAG TPA: hypothetical protein PLG08_08875 [Chitinophagaceae bacterium]|nr:hypothetical protein [Chitinophagaceae bacterium]